MLSNGEANDTVCNIMSTQLTDDWPTSSCYFELVTQSGNTVGYDD